MQSDVPNVLIPVHQYDRLMATLERYVLALREIQDSDDSQSMRHIARQALEGDSPGST